MLPSDTQKKKIANCGIALQYLEQAGVPLNDDEGTIIIAEDVANGEKELTLSLLWNMFIHLQVCVIYILHLQKRFFFPQSGMYSIAFICYLYPVLLLHL